MVTMSISWYDDVVYGGDDVDYDGDDDDYLFIDWFIHLYVKEWLVLIIQLYSKPNMFIDIWLVNTNKCLKSMNC